MSLFTAWRYKNDLRVFDHHDIDLIALHDLEHGSVAAGTADPSCAAHESSEGNDNTSAEEVIFYSFLTKTL